jgi:hypothetical protein
MNYAQFAEAEPELSHAALHIQELAESFRRADASADGSSNISGSGSGNSHNSRSNSGSSSASGNSSSGFRSSSSGGSGDYTSRALVEENDTNLACRVLYKELQFILNQPDSISTGPGSETLLKYRVEHALYCFGHLSRNGVFDQSEKSDDLFESLLQLHARVYEEVQPSARADEDKDDAGQLDEQSTFTDIKKETWTKRFNIDSIGGAIKVENESVEWVLEQQEQQQQQQSQSGPTPEEGQDPSKTRWADMCYAAAVSLVLQSLKTVNICAITAAALRLESNRKEIGKLSQRFRNDRAAIAQRCDWEAIGMEA